MDRFHPEPLVDAQLLSFVEASGSKPLDLKWNALLDGFYFAVNSVVNKLSWMVGSCDRDSKD